MWRNKKDQKNDSRQPKLKKLNHQTLAEGLTLTTYKQTGWVPQRMYCLTVDLSIPERSVTVDCPESISTVDYVKKHPDTLAAINSSFFHLASEALMYTHILADQTYLPGYFNPNYQATYVNRPYGLIIGEKDAGIDVLTEQFVLETPKRFTIAINVYDQNTVIYRSNKELTQHPPKEGFTGVLLHLDKRDNVLNTPYKAKVKKIITTSDLPTFTLNKHECLILLNNDQLDGLSIGEEVMYHYQTIPKFQEGMSFMMSGPLLMKNGKKQLEIAQSSDRRTVRAPRSCVGLNATGEKVSFIVVDGRQFPYSVGVSLDELVRLLQCLEIDTALNLDGGGSSQMALREKAVRLVNRPSVSELRKLRSMLIIK